MSWLSEFVFDPIKTLVQKILTDGQADLKVLAGQAAAALPSSPITATAETAFETGVTASVDAVITSVAGEVPAVGATLSAETIAAANAAIDYLTVKGAAVINAAAAAAKTKLAAYAAAA